MKNLTCVYHKVLSALDPEYLVRSRLQTPLASGPWDVLAVGKAAVPMALAAHRMLGSQMARGFLLTKVRHIEPGPRALLQKDFVLREAAHPVPDSTSEAATQDLLRWCHEASDSHNLLVLMSGGTSSLLAAPAPPLSPADLQEVQQALLGSGLPIEEMNVVRKHLSLIKGGQLAQHLSGYKQCLQLTLVDICAPALGREDILSLVGSGPLVADPSTRAEAERLLSTLQSALKPDLYKRTRSALRETPKASPVQAEVLADYTTLVDTAQRLLAEDFLSFEDWPRNVQGEVSDVAARFAAAARRLQQTGRFGVLAAAGEPTVKLGPETPGEGGRCQELALRFARAVAEQSGLELLAGSSDGTDGPGEFAGAIVDGSTWPALVRRVGSDRAEQMLARHDSGGALSQVPGCLLKTGPTGQNLNDLFLLRIAPGAGSTPS